MKMKRIRKDTHKVPAVTVVEQPSSQLVPLARQGNVTQLKEVPKTSQCLIHPCESIQTNVQISAQKSITYPTQKNGKILEVSNFDIFYNEFHCIQTYFLFQSQSKDTDGFIQHVTNWTMEQYVGKIDKE